MSAQSECVLLQDFTRNSVEIVPPVPRDKLRQTLNSEGAIFFRTDFQNEPKEQSSRMFTLSLS